MKPVRVWQVATAVFHESVRDRVPLSLVFFALLLMGAAYALSQLTAGQDLKVIKDLGLAAMTAIGLLIAIFIGVGLVAKEVERRSIFGLLSKPLTRTEFLAGKFAGLTLTLTVNVAMMTAAYFLMLWYLDLTTDPWIKQGWRAPALDPRLLLPVATIWLQLQFVTGVALLFSTFSSPLLSAGCALAFWIAAHFSADLRSYQAAVDSPAAVWLARIVYYLLPDVQALDIKNQVVHGLPVDAAAVGFAALHTVIYTALLLAVATAVFVHRDFK